MGPLDPLLFPYHMSILILHYTLALKRDTYFCTLILLLIGGKFIQFLSVSVQSPRATVLLGTYKPLLSPPSFAVLVILNWYNFQLD